MEPKDNRDSFTKKIYEVHTFNQNSVEIKRLPFELFHVCTAKFSGPTAMYLNKMITTDITFSSDESDNILMFSGKGTIFNKVPFTIKQKILAFEFLPLQVLFVATATSYYLVDPYRSSVKMIDLSESFKNDKVLGYKILESRLYVIVGKRGIFEIQNLHQPVPKQLGFLNINTENPIMFFQTKQDSDQPQIIYHHDRKEIYSFSTGNQILDCKQLRDPKSKLMYFNKWTHNSNVYYILVFHNPFKIWYYANGSQSSYEPPTVKIFEEKSSATPSKRLDNRHGIVSDNGYSCGWIQDTIYLSNKLWVIRLNGNGLNVMKKQQTIISQQIDGIRFFGQTFQMIRLASTQYLSIFKGSNNKSLLELYEVFQQYQNTTVVNMQLLQNNSSNKQQHLQVVLNAAQFSLDPLEQMRILKFGIFFKTYYCMRADLGQLCEQLRLINNLKYQVVNRCLTLNQLRYLKTYKLDQFVSILLRYNLHYIADLVGGGQKVYFHWAKCKIEKQRQDIALTSIVKKFNTYKQKKDRQLSYVDIARYAIETKRYQLAQNLIEYQSNIKKKVIILLWMASLKKQAQLLEKALDNADRSMDSDTINRVIFEVQKQYALSDGITKLLDKRYLRQKNPTKLKDYFLKKKQNNELGLLAMKSYLTQNNKTQQSFDVVKKLLPSVQKAQNTSKSSEYAAFLKRALVPSYQIQQSEIQKFKKEKNPQFLVQILLQRDLIDQAVSVIYGIGSDMAFEILIKIQRWSQAITLARERKNIQILNNLTEIAPQQFGGEIEAAFEKINNK